MPITPHDVDEIMARHARDWNNTFITPAQPPIETLAAQPARPRRTRWLLPAAAAAAVVAIAAIGVGLTHRHPTPTQTAATPVPTVAWATDPASTPSTTPATDNPQPERGPRYPVCRATQLGRPTLSPTGGKGLGFYRLVVPYLDTRPCSMRPSFETGTLLGADHSVVGDGGQTTAEGFIAWLDVLPGQSITSDLHICGGTARFVQLDLDNAKVERLQDTVIPTTPPACTLADQPTLTTFYGVANTTDSYRNLGITIDAPTTVTAGSTLRYTITLTNGTDTAISLRNCPSFTQTLANPFRSPDPAGSSDSYQLNCTSAVLNIQPHQQAVFDMRLRTSAEIGDLALTWFWIGDPISGDDHGYATAPRITVVGR